MSNLLATGGREAARTRRASLHLRPEVTTLDDRCLMAGNLGVEPSIIEQYMLQLVNRARANPTAESSRLVQLARTDPALKAAISDLELAAFVGEMASHAPVSPLAFNPRLVISSRIHDQRMLETNSQFHSELQSLASPTKSGEAASDRLPYFEVGQGSWSLSENIFAYSSNLPDAHGKALVDYFHAAFLLDWGNPGFGHLRNLMAPGPTDASASSYRASEIGIGIITDVQPTRSPGSAVIDANQGLNVGPALVTQQIAWREGFQFLVGAAYTDRDHDQFYTPGEGLGSILVRAVGLKGEGTFETTTWGAGGYSLALPSGTFEVTASGMGLSRAQTLRVTMAGANVAQDLVEMPTATSTPAVSPPAVTPASPTSPDRPNGSNRAIPGPQKQRGFRKKKKSLRRAVHENHKVPGGRFKLQLSVASRVGAQHEVGPPL